MQFWVYTEGKTPVMKKMLNKSANCLEIWFFRRNKILQGILFGLEALLELRENMVLAISSLSVGCTNILLPLVSFFCTFSYSGKVIIKGVNNAIEISYSITIVKREYTGTHS